MKLAAPLSCSQRDPLWGSILLGYNTQPAYTIHDFGCLITAFGNYVGKTPKEVNDILKANSGFVIGTGNVIWSKVTALGLQQIYQSPFYNDPVTSQGLSKMRELLDGGHPLVTHVDFNPTTVEDNMHWVLVIGYDANDVFWAIDSWTGTLINLDVYGGAARGIFEYRAYDKVLPKGGGFPADTVAVPRPQFEDFERVKAGWNQVREKLNVEDSVTIVLAEIDKLIGYEDRIISQEKTIEEASKQAAELQRQMQGITIRNGELLEANKKQAEQIKTEEENIYTLSTKLIDLQKVCNQKPLTGWKKRLYDLLTGSR